MKELVANDEEFVMHLNEYAVENAKCMAATSSLASLDMTGVQLLKQSHHSQASRLG